MISIETGQNLTQLRNNGKALIHMKKRTTKEILSWF
jgi:hypothetical protein